MTRSSLRSGRFQISAWTGLPDSGVLDVISRSAFDAVVLDMQHGLFDTATIARAIWQIAAAGKPAVVRVPLGDLAFVSRALDFGAAGVILPMIETVEQARAFVAAAKYPPVGQRSFGPTRAVRVLGYEDATAYVSVANTATLAIAMIETREAFDNLDAILDVEGLDGILVGPSDLSLALFGRLDPDGAQTVEAAAAIAERARAAGKFTSIYTSGPQAARRARDHGFDLACLAFDANTLSAVAVDLVQAVGR